MQKDHDQGSTDSLISSSMKREKIKSKWKHLWISWIWNSASSWMFKEICNFLRQFCLWNGN